MSAGHRAGARTPCRLVPVARRVGDLVLNLSAAVGALCVVAVVVGVALDVRPVVVRSGSMEPEIGVGALVVGRTVDADRLRVGDVVTVPRGASHVTHRVVELRRARDEVVLRLQGDANPTPDTVEDRVGEARRMVVAVPYAGYAVGWLSTSPGVFVLAGAVGVLLALALRPAGRPAGPAGPAGPRQRPGRRARRRRPAGRRAVGAARTTVIALAGAVAFPASPAAAAWSDGVPVTGARLSALTVTSPASATCRANVLGLGLLSASISWPGDARYDYAVVLRRSATSAVVSETAVTGDQASVTYSTLAGGLGVGVDYQVEVTAYLAARPDWRAAAPHVYRHLRVTVVLASCTDTAGT